MKLLTVIINYKTPDMTIDCVRAALAAQQDIDGARITVVENDSGDGSLDEIREAVRDEGWDDRVSVVASGHNGGFGYGNNFAIRAALQSDDSPDYVYLLNSDAFPDEHAVSRLAEYLDAHDDVGIVGSYIHGTDGVPHETAFRFPSFLSELEGSIRLGPVTKLLREWVVPLPLPEHTREVDWLAGASMMIRRQVFEQVGLFDETFFLYFEETDLCRRAKLAGWKTVYVKESSVAHIGSVSTGMKTISRMPDYWFDSRRHYFLKNHNRSYLWAANTAQLVGGTLWRLRTRVQRKPTQDPPRFMRDFIRHTVKGR